MVLIADMVFKISKKFDQLAVLGHVGHMLSWVRDLLRSR